MIQVTQIKASQTDTGATLSAEIRCPGSILDASPLWLCYPSEFYDCLSSSADPWIAMLLWPAMRLGQDLYVDAVASSKLVEAAPTLMDIMHCWDPRFRSIAVRSEGTSCDRKAGTATASFFSGGVDSFYTALKNTAPETPLQTRLTHLISVKGLDVRLCNEALWTQVRSRLRAAAADLGCAWVECATNVRELIPEDLIAWRMYYGAVLAGIALGMQGLWKSVMIPADFTYAEMHPNGSSPLMDPLWSTESVRFASDGPEATRVEKVVSRIAQSEVALEHLRVCWKNPEGRYNCGACEKCIRTMVGLEIAGVMDRCQSFDRPLDYRDVSRVALKTPGQRALMAQNYQAAQAAGVDRRLIRALKRCVDPSLAWRVRWALDRCARRVVGGLDRLLLAGRLRAWYRRTGAPSPERLIPPDLCAHTQDAQRKAS